MPSAAAIDGIDLRRFSAGGTYEAGIAIASLMLAEGWAEPVDLPELENHDLLDTLPAPPNLMREIFPPYYDTAPALALDRRRLPRRKF